MSESENQTQSIAANFAHELAGPLGSSSYALDLVCEHLKRLLDEDRHDYFEAGLTASVVAEEPLEKADPADKIARRRAQAIAHAPKMRALTSGLEGEELDIALALYEIGFGIKCAQLGVTTSQSIVKNLRNFSNLQDSIDEKVELYDTLKTAAAVSSHKIKSMTLTWDVEKIPEITANPFALTQIWMNIFKNAAEAGATTMNVELKRHGSDVRVIFVNNNSRLPTNIDLFEKGTSVGKENGNGIGLWMCREIIQAHGGMISARNLDKGGVEFFIELPIK